MCFPISIAIDYLYLNTPFWVHMVVFIFYLVGNFLLGMQKKKSAWLFFQVFLTYLVIIIISYLLAMVCPPAFITPVLGTIYLVGLLVLIILLHLLIEWLGTSWHNCLTLLRMNKPKKSTKIPKRNYSLFPAEFLTLCWKFLRRVAFLASFCLIGAITITFLWGPWDFSWRTISAHQYGAKSLAFNPEGNLIISGGLDGKIKVWQVNGYLVDTFVGHNGMVSSLSFSSDGNLIVSGSSDQTIKLWHKDDGLMTTIAGHKEAITSVDISPNNNLIAAVSRDKTIKLWHTDGSLESSFSRGDDWFPSLVTFSPDGKLLAYDNYGTIGLLKVNDATLVNNSTEKNNNYDLRSIAFGPAGNLIASGGWDKTVKLWQIDGKLVNVFNGHNDVVESVTFNPDGKLLASGSRDKTIKLWTVGGILIDTLVGHRYYVQSVTFSPDGKLLASLDAQGFIKLWKVKEAK